MIIHYNILININLKPWKNMIKIILLIFINNKFYKKITKEDQLKIILTRMMINIKTFSKTIIIMLKLNTECNLLCVNIHHQWIYYLILIYIHLKYYLMAMKYI